jgi:hypothetical protein
MAIVSKAKKQPAHIRKLSGGHHRKSKSYSKPYWPYLPMLAVIGLGLLVNTLWANTGHILGVHSDLSATTLLATTNAARTSDHEPSLTFNSQLMQAAQTKAADMVAQNYWSHDTPEGKTPWTFITAAGYDYQLAGENLAYGFSDGSSLISAWMSSPEHRANILNTDFQNVGFGIASSPDYQNKGPEIIVVALYAEPVVSAVSISFTVLPAQLRHRSRRPTYLILGSYHDSRYCLVAQASGHCLSSP